MEHSQKVDDITGEKEYTFYTIDDQKFYLMLKKPPKIGAEYLFDGKWYSVVYDECLECGLYYVE